MASIRKRGEYQWQVEIRKRGWPYQSKIFKLKADAERWARMIEGEMDKGIFVDRHEAESTSLDEALVRYEKEISSHKRGTSQEQSVIKAWRTSDLSTRSLASIRASDISSIRDDWLKEYQAATVLRRLSVLSHLFNVARIDWGMESLSNPVESIRKPQPDNARDRRIQKEYDGETGNKHDELELIISATSSYFLPKASILAVETAMRRSEIAGLRWEHISIKKKVAHLPKTKNGAARDVPLSTIAVSVLESLPHNINGKVFAVRADALTRAFERALLRAREIYEHTCRQENRKPDPKFLVDLTFHDLRHEATSRLAAIYQIHELAKVTGHKDLRMLMRYYHPRAEDLAKKLN